MKKTLQLVDIFRKRIVGSMDKSDVAISVMNLTKTYNLYKRPSDRVKEIFSITKKSYSKKYHALNNISFQVKKGETLGIIGKNGAGKSTLLKMITGVTKPTNGEISVNGEVSALLELGTGFNPEYNGYENIYLNGSMRGYSREEMKTKLQEIVDFADIGEYMEQPIKTYSSGMLARLAFSVMICFKPDILIVDEALSVGDVFFQQKCNTYMKEAMTGVTKILVTHDMNSIANMADRVILLDKGELVQEGKPLEVIQNYLKIMHTEVFAESTKDNENELSEKKNDLKSIKSQKEKEWIPVEKSEVGGAGDIIITGCKLTINHENICLVKSGDELQLYAKVMAKKAIPNLIIGYIIKDKYGNSIAGENTIGSNVRILGVEKGKSYIYTIKVKWPDIKEGDYFITIGLGEGTDQMVHTIQCWAHNVIHVEAIATVPMHGIINNNILQVTRSEM